MRDHTTTAFDGLSATGAPVVSFVVTGRREKNATPSATHSCRELTLLRVHESPRAFRARNPFHILAEYFLDALGQRGEPFEAQPCALGIKRLPVCEQYYRVARFEDRK